MTRCLRGLYGFVCLMVVAITVAPVFAQAPGGRGQGAAPPAGRGQAPAGRPTAPPSATARPTLVESTKVLDVAVATLNKLGVAESCVVTDSRGDMVALHRMDRARFYLNEIARGKALASVMSGLTTGGGGVPLVRNNQVYGAIGCSGGTGGQDQDAAVAGAAAF